MRRGWIAALVGLLTAAFGAVGVASPAAAQSAIILPRTGGSGVGPEAREAAREALRDVLLNERWDVFSLDEVSEDLPARLAACGPEDRCEAELQTLLDVDVVVGLRVWGTEDAVERVAVTVVGERGVGQHALAEVTPDEPLPFAVAEAARAAIALWATGDVSGAYPPPVQSDLSERWEEARVAPSPLNWFVGSLLVLGSTPLLGYGINSAVLDGECLEEAAGGCVERIRFREGAGILTTMGVTLLVSGIVTWIVQPLRFTVNADLESASLSVSGTF
jgi:hypothetical protein